MDDNRVWGSEEGLWTAEPGHYRLVVDEQCLMVLPSVPFIVTGKEAADAVADTPRWTKAVLTDRKVSRPQDGLIVIAYRVKAERDGVSPFEARCTSTYRRLAHDDWRVVQHQQTAIHAT